MYTLLLIDMQQAFCSDTGSYGARGCSLKGLEHVVLSCSNLLKAFRDNGFPVAHVITRLSPGYGDSGAFVYDKFPEIRTFHGYLENYGECDFPVELRPEDGEIVLHKKRFSPFFNTGLHSLLLSMNTSTVVLAGVLTNVCVYSGALSAVDLDYRVIIAEECTTAWTSQIKDMFLQSCANHIGEAESMSEIVHRLKETRQKGIRERTQVNIFSTGLPAGMDDLLEQKIDSEGVDGIAFRTGSMREIGDANNPDIIIEGYDGFSTKSRFLDSLPIRQEACDNLRGVISLSPTRDSDIDLVKLKESGIQYVPMTAVYQQTCADHAIMLLMCANRRFTSYQNFCIHGCARELKRTSPQGLETVNWAGINYDMDLSGKKLVILGFGGIGLEMVTRLRIPGLQVYYYKRNRLQPTFERLLNIRYIKWDDAFAIADFLVVTLPLYSETYNIIGKLELEKLSREAVIVQMGRAAVIDRTALYHVVSNGKISFYVADVHYEEPLREDDEFLKLSNVVLTPHYGGGIKYRRKTVDQIFQNMNAILKGERAPFQYELPGWSVPWEQFRSVGDYHYE